MTRTEFYKQATGTLPALFCLTVITGCVHKPVGDMTFPPGEVQHYVPADTPWKPCPPGVPDGCKMILLEGNPKSADLFSVRFRLNDTFVVQAHTHPKDERVTILEGQLSIAFGKDATRDEAKQYGPGDYYVNARGAVHTVWVDKPSVIQITGIGPWQLDYIDTP